MNKPHLYGLINPVERIAGWEALLGDWPEWWYRQPFLIIPAGIITGCYILVRLRIRPGGAMQWNTLPFG